jgi:hypothetical protein
MRKRIKNKWEENRHLLGCPHCGAGADVVTVGLCWDFDNNCWQCIICGYRAYEQIQYQRNPDIIVAERLWDEVLEALDKEENDHMAPAL